MLENYEKAVKGIVEIMRPYLIAEIQAATGYLGNPITPEILKQLTATSDTRLMMEAQLARETVALRQIVEAGEYTRRQIDGDRIRKEPPKRLVS